MAHRAKQMRQLLIEAGIVEINSNGVAAFSVRRVAAACGVSCAAPYKHFKDKREFIAAIVEYVNGQWEARQEEIVAACTGGLQAQLVEIAVGYLRFLMERSWFRSILMHKDDQFDSLYHRFRVSGRTQLLQERFFMESGWEPEKARRKIHIVRAILFGTVFLIDTGELTYSEEVVASFRSAVDREFNLP